MLPSFHLLLLALFFVLPVKTSIKLSQASFMAESEANHTTDTLVVESQAREDNGNTNLKYLDFVQSAAIYFVVHLSAVYDYARQNAGPLKPGVQTVESTVKTVIGPVYEKLQDVPSEILKFVDRKLDDTLTEVNRHMPPLMKQASTQAIAAAQKSGELARELVSELQNHGVVHTAANLATTVYTKLEPTAKDLYTNYEPVAEKYAVSAWRSMNRLPLFPQLAHILLLTATYWADKYNQAVGYTAEKGYPVAQYLPLVPIEKIAKVFEEEGERVVALPPLPRSGGQEIMVET